jgi:hypothetical protein
MTTGQATHKGLKYPRSLPLAHTAAYMELPVAGCKAASDVDRVGWQGFAAKTGF